MASPDAAWPDVEEDDAAASSPGIKWTPLRMLHMEYPEGDKLGHILAWFSMTPFFIFAGMVTLILFRRDLHTISFTLGQLVNEVFNLILKKIIKGEGIASCWCVTGHHDLNRKQGRANIGRSP